MSKTIEDFLNETLVIMVIFRCPPEKSESWNSLVRETAQQKAMVDLFVYDNSPEPRHFPSSPFIKMRYKHNSNNPGISMAYNEGCALASEKKKRWLLLLDQDTSFAEGWLQTYFQNSVEKPSALIKVPILLSGSVIVSPFRYWLTKGVPSSRVEPGNYSLNRYFAINSGLLIDREVFESVEGYDETIPLDFSDFAFMCKLKRNKYRLEVINLHGHHGLSSFHEQDENAAKERFKQYSLGSKRLTRYTRQSFFHFLLGVGRAVRLGIHYRSLHFISILLQSWISG